MNAQNYTQKSLEAIQAAQKLTIENQNQQIEQIHLLAALLKQENGLVPQLLKKMGVTLAERPVPSVPDHEGGLPAGAAVGARQPARDVRHAGGYV